MQRVSQIVSLPIRHAGSQSFTLSVRERGTKREKREIITRGITSKH